VRWPGKIKAASQCTDLVELSDFLPTICELTGVKVETINPIHGRSFAPQLLGRTGDPRSWVHVQDVNKRHLRSRDWILNNSEKFIPVNEIGQAEKKPVHSIPEKAKPEHEALKKALKELN
jgi:arylsulfatase A